MSFTLVDPLVAPKPVRASSNLARQSEYDAYVSQVVQTGKTGSLTPEGKDTHRALAHRLTHAAKRQGVQLSVWTADGAVWFTLAPSKKAKAKADRPADKPADKPA